MTAANVRAHAELLIEKQRGRLLKAAATSVLDRLNEAPADLVESLESAIAEVRTMGTADRPNIDRQVESAIQANQDVIRGKIPAHDWPVPALTRATKGIRSGKFYLVVALYKTGKSKLLTATLTHLVVEQNVPCLFFSLEMRSTQVLNWMAAYALKINSAKYGTPELSENELEHTNDWMQRRIATPGLLHINDRSVHTPESICAEMRRAVMRHGVKVVFIDFLQRINFGRKDVVAEIERGVNLIASTARDLSVAIIALSQVPKSAEKKGKGEHIHMGDVKSSGAFAEAADCSIAITDPDRHRDTESGVRYLKFVVEGRDVRSRMLDIQADLRYGHFNTLTRDEPHGD
jgi:replicative DNA helicase